MGFLGSEVYLLGRGGPQVARLALCSLIFSIRGVYLRKVEGVGCCGTYSIQMFYFVGVKRTKCTFCMI